MDVSTVTASAAVDLFLLAEGDMFVGAFGGHMSRLAFELLVGRVVPYVSGQVPPHPFFVPPPPHPARSCSLRSPPTGSPALRMCVICACV